MRGFLALLLACIATPVLADPWPAAYRVDGVAAADVLNIRAAPDAGAEVLATIAPFAMSVEVLGRSPDGRWGEVGLPEGNGWVNMRFLAATPTPAGELPRPLSCLGTEPFWSIQFPARGGAVWSDPETPDLALDLVEETVVDGQWGGFLLRLADAQGALHTLTVTRARCSDGMSDRAFGFSVLRVSSRGPALERGCCTLDHRD